jgi:hypothetical protein
MVLHNLIRRISQLRYRQAESLEKQSGQSLIILAFAFLGLVAMLGLALDLGLVYVERVRIKRAVDAATLAGVVELPYEQQSFDRAMEYLTLNGYDVDDPDTYVFVAGCLRDVQDRFDNSCNLTNQSNGDTSDFCRTDAANPYLYNKPVTNPYTQPTNLPVGATWFLLDTTTYKGEISPDCDASQLVFGTANKLEITGTVSVNMNFMQFFGWDKVDVPDNALAENVSSLDVGVVFDISGSMGYDPVCRGCWYKTNTDLTDIPPQGGTYPYYYDYPKNGDYRTIVSTTVTSNLCTTDPPESLFYGSPSRRYQVIEAELYSRNTSVIDTRFREAGRGYWVLQRNGSSAARFNNDSSEPGTYVSQHPEMTYYPENQPYGRFYTLVDAQSGAAPRLEYQFSFKSESSPTWGSQAQIWIRARRGDQGQDLQGNTNRGTIYWALDRGSTPLVWPPQTNTYVENLSGWRMVYLTTINVEYGMVYTLKLYAGSSGYAIDRIFVTSNTSVPSTVQTSRAATPGSARGQACDICNPIFGETVTPDMCAGYYPVYTTTNNLSSPIWADANQPMRTSKEAIKNFVERLDPAFDQVAFIPFTSNNSSWTTISSELSCLQASRRQGIDCYDGTNPISYTLVLREIERVEPQSFTCTACGMRLGLQALGFNTDNDPNFDNSCDGSADSHCGRGGGANKVLVLITDGVPNHTPIGVTCDPLNAGGVTYNNTYNGSSYYDCVLNYAEMAANKGITVYAIGLGFGVDGEFLAQVAALGNGQYYQAGSPSDLDLIFDEILTNIYVRIIR